jgi:dephospho-CoA kinase
MLRPIERTARPAGGTAIAYVIGLTGNIACGKSTVARMLADLGAQVIDADELVHDLEAPGTLTFAAIVERYQTSILHADGTLDRVRLGEIVFSDPKELAWIEGIIHPAVIAETERLISASESDVLVVEAVKLVEAGMRRLCDTMWIVICRPDAQLARLVARGTDETYARGRIAAQPDLAPKLALADVVIENSGPLESTRAQVLAAWAELRAL